MPWEAGPAILEALSFICLGRPRLVLYLVEETLTVLLCITVLLTLMWITLTAIFLFWKGASLVFIHFKRIMRRGTSVADSAPDSSQAMSLQR